MKLKQAKDLAVGDVVVSGGEQPDRKVLKVSVDGDFVHAELEAAKEFEGQLSASADAMIAVQG